jgi:hypothetical protein
MLKLNEWPPKEKSKNPSAFSTIVILGGVMIVLWLILSVDFKKSFTTSMGIISQKTTAPVENTPIDNDELQRRAKALGLLTPEEVTPYFMDAIRTYNYCIVSTSYPDKKTKVKREPYVNYVFKCYPNSADTLEIDFFGKKQDTAFLFSDKKFPFFGSKYNLLDKKGLTKFRERLISVFRSN